MCWPIQILAQQLPALYDVAGVASDDTLSVRVGPGVSSDKVSTLAHNAKGIEIVALSKSNWGLTNIGERSAWVSMAYLQRQPGQDGLPKVTRCYGTEPFWGLRLDGNTLTLDGLDPLPKRMSPIWKTGSMNVPNAWAFGAGDVRAVMTRQMCNDGMSDREFGLGVELLIGDGPDTRMASGCCSLN